jgi:hypothetical protein
MFLYLFPIFCFGLVITGIVFLGLRQAADLARQTAQQGKATSPVSDHRGAGSLSCNAKRP